MPSKSSYQLVTQPKFAEQIRNLPAPVGVQVPLQRGWMIWAQSGNGLGYTGGPLGDGRDMINFLFNPSTITADYNVSNTTLASAQMYKNVFDQGTYQAHSLMQTVSFDLYFDRTYELNYGSSTGAINDPAVIGVQADVYQFMQFTGVTFAGSLQSASIISQIGSKNLNLQNQVLSTTRSSGLMMLVPSFLFFGNAYAQMNQNASNDNLNAIGSQQQYYGYISEWTPNFTHFTAAMVPIRCVISVTFTMLSNPPVNYTVGVWRDAANLGSAPYQVAGPYPTGYKPPTGFGSLTVPGGGL